jgi:outer membrane protein OmpA-like peptidoglycan-associated protein
MPSARSTGVVFFLVCAAATAACAPHLPFRHHQHDLVVLLRDEDGTVGKAVVSNARRTVTLDEEREATRVSSHHWPQRPAAMADADVRGIFGAALASMPDTPQRFTLNFEFESDQLTADAQAIVPQIINAVAQRASPDVVVVGHTDTMGTPAANFELGMKRAMTVRSLLVDAGLDPALIEVTSLGESDLLVHTPDETPEPRNRRVDITVR